jgi:hypothetical protein
VSARTIIFGRASDVFSSGRGHSEGGLTSTEDDLTPTSSRAQSPEPTTPGTPPSTHSVPMQRAISEPPEVVHSFSVSPPQYSWEWGNFPKSASIAKHSGSEPASRAPERASTHHYAPPTLAATRDEKSAAVVDEELAVHFGKGGRLTAGDVEGFVLELEGRTVSFDLSLCGDLSEVMRQDNEGAENAVGRFAQRRVTFQQFIDDPAIVHNDNLCVRWKDRYLFFLPSNSGRFMLIAAVTGSSRVGTPPQSLRRSLSGVNRPSERGWVQPQKRNRSPLPTSGTCCGQWPSHSPL